MSLVGAKTEEKTMNVFYLSHQPVVRETNLTIKVRVVFKLTELKLTEEHERSFTYRNQSTRKYCRDCDTFQKPHLCIYVLTADIAMMYRQILVAKEDKDLQRIC